MDGVLGSHITDFKNSTSLLFRQYLLSTTNGSGNSSTNLPDTSCTQFFVLSAAGKASVDTTFPLIPKSNSPQEIDFSNSIGLIGQFIASGAVIKCVFTISINDDSLKFSWSWSWSSPYSPRQVFCALCFK